MEMGNLRRSWRVAIRIALVLACASVLLAALLYDRAATNRARLCENQHSLVEMQLLFLEEHAAIREDLRGAGIPAEHADPDLLDKLEALIRQADCLPDR